MASNCQHLPGGYKKVDALLSTGTQIIVLPVAYNEYFGMKYSFTSYESEALFGNNNNIDSTQGRFYAPYIGPPNNCITYGWGGNIITNISVESGNKYSASTNFLNNGQVFFNNELIANLDKNTKLYDSQIGLFGFTAYKGARVFPRKCIIYNAKISLGDDIILDLIPSVRIEDNKPGMYDLVNHHFYTNNGTGEFIVHL